MRLACVFLLLCATVAAFGSHTTKKLLAKDPKKWHAEVDYIEFKGSTPLVKFANREILKAAKAILAEFIDSAKEGPSDPSYQEFEHLSTAKVELETPNVLSVRIGGYSDNGAAHPYNHSVFLNFGLVDGKPVRLKLKDIDTSSREVSRLVEAFLRKEGQEAQLGTSFVHPLYPDQLEMFSITPKGLTYVFEQDEYAGYALGGFYADVFWKDLKHLKRKSPVWKIAHKH